MSVVEGYDSYIRAGEICAQARQYGVSLIVVGASNLAVSKKIEEKIRELGGQPAFPVQISVNHIAAHFCADPNDSSTFAIGDVCKLDLGVHVDGYIADTAITVDLGNHAALLAASREACEAAIALVKPGVPFRALGKVINDSIVARGFQPVRNLGGHGLARYVIHDHAISVPNYDNGDESVLEEGMVLAIEPFASTGAGFIHDMRSGNIYSHLAKKPVRNPYARKVQDEIAKFGGLPFTTHWLSLPQKAAEMGLRELMAVGALEAHPPLVESAGVLISQHEHSLIVTKDGCIVYTRD